MGRSTPLATMANICMKVSVEKKRTKTPTIKTEKGQRQINQRTNGPVNAHLMYWPTKAQNIQHLEHIW